jgi:DNA-binding GntR family transcriptional regulator
MGGREAGDRQAAGESNPIPRGNRDTGKGGLVEIKPYRGFYVRSFSRSETADLYELFKRLECFAVELAVPEMSDHDIRRLEGVLIEAGAALQRGDAKTYAMRDREFCESIAEQSYGRAA